MPFYLQAHYKICHDLETFSAKKARKKDIIYEQTVENTNIK